MSVELPAPFADSPVFWLGRVREIVDLEARSKLSRSNAYSSIKEIVRQMEERDFGAKLRASAMVNELKKAEPA